MIRSVKNRHVFKLNTILSLNLSGYGAASDPSSELFQVGVFVMVIDPNQIICYGN